MRNLQLKLETFFAVILTTLLLVVGITPAYAADFIPAQTTSNNNIHVAATNDGRLAWSNDKVTWSEVKSPLTKNGVSTLTYANGLFIASSFFSGAYSTDGKTWQEFTLPVGEKFSPGNIISDNEFFQSNSMTADQIQKFIESKNTSCVTGYTCLPKYTETTWSRDATPMCKTYTGAANETAAIIIAKVSEACGVSAEVLLVLLQKEQSLLTHTAPTQQRYNTATGYACPDTAACDTQYYGFYNQVYNAAKQYKRYSNPVGTSLYYTWYPVGKTTNVRWNPDSTCGSAPVFIENQATAGLYYYTPYQPNAAALQAWASTGDKCSAYGNRNFWRLYNIWFNKEANYKTFIAGGNGTYVAVDADGTTARAININSWSLNLAPITVSEKITSLTYNSSKNQYEAGTSKTDLIYVSTNNGASWVATSPTPAPTPTPTTSQSPAPTPTTSQSPATAPTTSPTPPPSPTPTTSVPVTPTPTVKPVPAGTLERTVGSYYTNRRPSPTTTVKADAVQLKPNQIVTISGWVRGQKVDGNDIWYKIAGTNLYSWSGGFTSQSITNVPNLTPPSTPTTTTTTVPAIIHTIVKGDTVWALSIKYKTTVANIVAWNKLPSNGSKIYVGQKLIVKPASVINTIKTP